MLSTKEAPGLVPGNSISKGSNKMAKVKVLVGVVASGFDCKAGNEYDLTEEDALMLIRMKKAVPVEAATKKSAGREDAPKTTKRSK
tara:strand:+ start:590 stop:847 length:258 start_codon:yes stop_codon:yes gene_type:complete